MSESFSKFLNELYDSVEHPIQVIDEEGKIIYVNHSYINQWDYNLTELKDYSVFNDLLLKKNGIQSTIRKVFREKGKAIVSNYVDTLLRSKDITAPLFQTTIFHINADSENYLVLVHEDQTEKILAEEEVKRARDGNREAERLKNTFLNVLSHELRTPLNIILGYSSIIKENLKEKLSAEDRVYLDNLYSGSERLFKSITQMLEFAQIEAGDYNLHIETADLVAILQSCISSIAKVASDKKLEVKINFKEKNVFVDIDIHCVETAINNILGNAIKFTKQGFIEVELEILESRDLAVIKIRDTGVGISTQYMDHLFIPFSQEDLNIGRNYEGNGLGLALAKRYIERNGGSLLADSIKGVGSTFTFTLPLTKRLNESRKLRNVEQRDDLKKILMLDDLSESYELINAFLKNTHNIEIFNYSEFDIDTIDKKEFDVLIFDVNQNYWDTGIELCRSLKEKDPFKRPVIVVSTEYNEVRIKNFYDAGADKFLIKPFSKSDLLNALSEAELKT
jgi:PAS domain S-box-containing protein